MDARAMIDLMKRQIEQGTDELTICRLDEGEFGVGEEITRAEVMEFDGEDFLVLL